jgi:hypothetical protein
MLLHGTFLLHPPIKALAKIKHKSLQGAVHSNKTYQVGALGLLKPQQPTEVLQGALHNGEP